METTQKERCLVLLSGGLVSSVMLLDCIQKGMEPVALTFIADGASKEQIKEREAGRLIAAYNDIQSIAVDLSTFKRLLSHIDILESARKGEKVPNPEDGEYEDEQAEAKQSKVLPRHTMLGMAETIAEKLGIEKIFVGERDGSDLFAMARGLNIPLDRDWCPWKDAYEMSLKAEIKAPEPKEATPEETKA